MSWLNDQKYNASAWAYITRNERQQNLMPGKNYTCSHTIFKGKELNLQEWEWSGMKQKTEKKSPGIVEEVWL